MNNKPELSGTTIKTLFDSLSSEVRSSFSFIRKRAEETLITLSDKYVDLSLRPNERLRKVVGKVSPHFLFAPSKATKPNPDPLKKPSDNFTGITLFRINFR